MSLSGNKRLRHDELQCDTMHNASTKSEESTESTTSLCFDLETHKRMKTVKIRKSDTDTGLRKQRAAATDTMLREKRNAAFGAMSEVELERARADLAAKSPPRLLVQDGFEFRVLTTCVGCNQQKEMLHSHFAVDHGMKQLTTTRAGHECFKNSPAYPCNECWKRMMIERNARPENVVRILMVNYSHESFRTGLHAYQHPPILDSDGNVLRAFKPAVNGTGWFAIQWEAQGGTGKWNAPTSTHPSAIPYWLPLSPALCSIYGVDLVFGDKLVSPSVNNFDLTTGRDAKNHIAKNCELVCTFANVQQHDAIPDLRKASHDAIRGTLAVLEARAFALVALQASPSEPTLDGTIPSFSSECADALRDPMSLHAAHEKRQDDAHLDDMCKNARFRECLRKMAINHKRDDSIRGQSNDFATRDELLANLKAHGPRCDVTHMLFTAENGPFFPSCDRIDNARGHVNGNVRWVARLFCGPANPTRLEWLRDIVLKQTAVPLTPRQRELVEKEVLKLT